MFTSPNVDKNCLEKRARKKKKKKKITMLLSGLYTVFSLLTNGLYGYLSFIALMLCILTLGFAYDTIRKLLKEKLSEESLRKGPLYNKNVIITGGSSGIGKCLAIQAASQGANVTLIARNPDKLELAREEVERACLNKDASQRIECVPLDVTRDYALVEREFANMEKKNGPCYMLVNCAGIALCAKIEDTTPDMIKHMVDLNLMGSYYCTKAVVPEMKQAKEGRIVLVSSQAALVGIFGYSAYSATKFAVRGLAESLAMELTPHNVHVTLSLPPDTDTPGFAIEEQTKILETKLISQTAALVQPEVVAEKILKDALEGKFISTTGLESFAVATLCAGMSPYSSFSELITQVILMSPLRIVAAFILHSFHSIVTKCINEREKQKKSE